jgi:uncharacterized repeat protein (TIGR03837 family)
MSKRWDIFCHVVDNYGDAGVCWRIAQQLANEFDLDVRLWIDDLAALQKIYPNIASHREQQICAGVTVVHWSQPLPSPTGAADVVIEAFACELPEEYLAAMRKHRSLWINLEYLSAEPWVGGCHGLPSIESDALQTNAALKKFFFFPGFRPDTGGVLGERDLAQRRREFQSAESGRAEFLGRFGVEVPAHAVRVSLFAYRDAPIEKLLRAWMTQPIPLFCFVPEGQPLAAVESFLGHNLPVGAVRQAGALTVATLPFLPQDDYDRLLWSCDINFVRGEDSFVRAQWAGLPFVWQIYAQPERAHWPKLEAFLQLYCAELSPLSAAAQRDFWMAWNGEGDIEAAWRAYAEALPALRSAAENWAVRLESGTNLAAALVQFCSYRV